MFALMFLVSLQSPPVKTWKNVGDIQPLNDNVVLWKCTDWRPLQTDTVQQVKICEYRK